MMSECGDCKIGRTRKDPKERLKQLQTGASEKLSLVCSFSTSNMLLLERMLHSYYWSKRKTGEWFALSDADILDFKGMCEKLEKTVKVLEEENFYIKKRYGI